MKKLFSKEKGITMITLTLMIIVMIVIMSVITFYVSNSIHAEQFQKLKADIREIESKALMYYVQEGIVPVYSGGNSDRLSRSDIRGDSRCFNPNDGNDYAKVNLELLGVVPAYDTTYYINIESLTVYAIDPVKIKEIEYPRMASDFSKIAINSNIPSWEEECFSDIENAKNFDYDDKGYIIGSKKDQITNLVIPAFQPNGKPVIGISDTAFKQVSVNGFVKIPNTVKKLPSSLFSNKNKITQIYCDASGIAVNTFDTCAVIEEVILGPSCVMPDSTGVGLFAGSSETLKRAWIETKSLGSRAFINCSKLQVVVLNNNVEVIPEYFFCNCTNMILEIRDSYNGAWPSYGTTANFTNFPKNLKRVDKAAFYNVKKFASSTLELSKYKNLIYIGSRAFMGAQTSQGVSVRKVLIRDALNYQPDSFPEGVNIVIVQ